MASVPVIDTSEVLKRFNNPVSRSRASACVSRSRIRPVCTPITTPTMRKTSSASQSLGSSIHSVLVGGRKKKSHAKKANNAAASAARTPLIPATRLMINK